MLSHWFRLRLCARHCVTGATPRKFRSVRSARSKRRGCLELRFRSRIASACKFRFRRRPGDKWDRFTLGAEPRSLYLMKGESRHDWEHSIPAVEARRYSITFRTMASAASE
jgi:hypothetical protein